jgi:spore maturation protein CgeB
MPKGKIGPSLGRRTGFRIWQPLIRRHLRKSARELNYQVVWVDCGAEIAPLMLRELTRNGAKSINYNHDDPFGSRDGRKWDLYRKCVPAYDLLVVVRRENLIEARDLGARKVVRVFRPCDPVAHAPVPQTIVDQNEWSSEVVFVGNWMPERGPFLARLLELGIPLTIYGTEWGKAKEWPELSKVVRPGVLGINYVKAIQYAKVALGLLSKGNRDLHTTRSAEIPFIGGAAFCAERTTEHEAMFQDREQAVFWSVPEECAAGCRLLLANDELRSSMVAKARQRIEELGLTNDRVCAGVLDTLTADKVLAETLSK